jgi:hypothetical protein
LRRLLEKIFMNFNFTLARESWRGTRKRAVDVRYQTVRPMVAAYRPRPEDSAPDKLSTESI